MKQKNRSLKLILSRLNWVAEVKKKQFNNLWKPWVDESKKVRSSHGMGIYCGMGKTPKDYPLKDHPLIILFKDYPLIIQFGDGGYIVHRADSVERHVYSCLDKELPLMATDPYWSNNQSAMELIEKRLKGEIKGYPWRQDLVDRYIMIEHLFQHSNKVQELYTQKLKEILQDKYSSQIYRNHGENVKLIVLESNGHKFYIDNSRGKFQILSEEDILTLKV